MVEKSFCAEVCPLVEALKIKNKHLTEMSEALIESARETSDVAKTFAEAAKAV